MVVVVLEHLKSVTRDRYNSSLVTKHAMATSIPKKAGRPTIGATPLSPAEKQRRYRERQKTRKTEGLFTPSEKSRVTLLEALGECLKYLDREDLSEIMRETNRQAASTIMSELATRYEITIAI